jgi:hypothetical protein
MSFYDCYFTRLTGAVSELVLLEADNDDEACAKADDYFAASPSYLSVEIFGNGRFVAELHRSKATSPRAGMAVR